MQDVTQENFYGCVKEMQSKGLQLDESGNLDESVKRFIGKKGVVYVRDYFEKMLKAESGLAAENKHFTRELVSKGVLPVAAL